VKIGLKFQSLCKVSIQFQHLDTISPHGRRAFSVTGPAALELPERRTAWTVVNCEQFQTVT